MSADSLLQALGLGITLTVLLLLVVRRQRWRQRSGGRLWSVMVGVAFISMPLWVPLPPGNARPVVAAFALAWAMKVAQLQAGLVARNTEASLPRFLVWLLVPPKTEFTSTPQARRKAQIQALQRAGRAVIKAALLLLLIQIKARDQWFWPASVWAAGLEIYFIISGIADLVTAFTLAAGFATDEVFAAPFAARSPSEFWGRRWNLFVGGFLRRFVFKPLARGGHVYRAAAAVFFVSGLAHEYFVYVCVEAGTYEPGYMLAFFALQGVAVMCGAWWRLHLKPVRFAPAVIKVVLNLIWLAATAPLFIWPIRTLLAQFERHLAWIPMP